MKPTVYIETTIISYLTAWPSKDIIRRSHELITASWWKDARPHFDLYTSIFTHNEASVGDPAAAADRMKELQGIPLLPIAPQVAAVAAQLERALSLPAKARTDAAHLAISAVNGMGFLLTWNCRHLANAVLTDRIERVCAAAGYVAPRIVTPEMLMVPP